MLLISRLVSAENSTKEKEQKILELETSLIDANTEVSKLNEEKRVMEEEAKTKDEQNELLVGVKNKMEENIARFNSIIQKMYKERTAMKNIIEKQKNTIELSKNPTINQGDVGEANTEMAAKLENKTKELNQANADKRRLAKDLAAAQSKNKDEHLEGEDDKVSKLTNILKNKNVETKKANDEVKRLTAANKEIQEKLNIVNNTKVVLEAKTTRLEKQVEDLIETCGQTKEDVGKKVSFDTTRRQENTQIKCMNNDKGRCRYGSNCHYEHSEVVCKSVSKA